MRFSLLLPALLLCIAVVQAAPTTLVVNDPGDNGSGTCATTCTLRDAIANIASGGTITFDPSILPAVISLNGEMHAYQPMTLQGPGIGRLTIDAGGLSPILIVELIGTITISGMKLTNGANYGIPGADGNPGTGLYGENGSDVSGGCIDVAGGSLILQQVLITNCVAQGGDGGAGGSGVQGVAMGGTGGAGGNGGAALGGAVSVDQGEGAELTLIATTIADSHAIGGNGGAGGDGGNGIVLGDGGNGGSGGKVLGGAIYLTGTSASLLNSTLDGNYATSGNGGNGGRGDATLVSATGGNGGNSGDTSGGQIALNYLGGTGYLDYSSVVGGPASGPGLTVGKGGPAYKPGTNGSLGTLYGSQIFALGAATPPNAQVWLRSSVVIDAENSCFGEISAETGVANLSNDTFNSCHTSLLDNSVVFLPRTSADGQWIDFPVYRSAVIDAATSCTDHTGNPVLYDEIGTTRPQGSFCDLGAIEADYIFVGTFD